MTRLRLVPYRDFPALSTEDSAHLLVDGKNRHARQEMLENRLAPHRISRVVDTLGKRDNADAQAGGPQLPQSLRDGLDLVDVVDDPVGVQEVRQAHKATGIRVAIKRSA